MEPAYWSATGGRMDARAHSAHPAAAAQTPRHGTWKRTHGVSDTLVCRAGAVQPDDGPISLASIPSGNSLTGKPDAGDPPVRFGGRGGGHPPSLPLLPAQAGGLGKAAKNQNQRD